MGDETGETPVERPDPGADSRSDAGPDPDFDPRTVDQIDGEYDDDTVPFDAGADGRALIDAARRRHGSLGGVVAAGMLGLDIALGRKPREHAPIVVDAPTEPVDIDTDGITVAVDEHTDVIAPAIPRTAPMAVASRRRRRR